MKSDLGIGPVPGRSRIGIYEEKVVPTVGTVIKPLGYFSTETDANRAIELIDQLLFGEKK